jgi:hypothetical protein
LCKHGLDEVVVGRGSAPCVATGGGARRGITGCYTRAPTHRFTHRHRHALVHVCAFAFFFVFVFVFVCALSCILCHFLFRRFRVWTSSAHLAHWPLSRGVHVHDRRCCGLPCHCHAFCDAQHACQRAAANRRCVSNTASQRKQA